MHSILILKDNKLVFEEYFYEYTRDSLQEMRSASKSVVSALAGIAISTANIFLTPEEQAVFCKMHKDIYPVPNKWGEKGATTLQLGSVPKNMIQEALLSAYDKVIKAGKAR